MASAAVVAAAQPIGFVQYLESKLSIPMLEDLAKKLVTYADEHIPGATGADKKAYCIKQADTILEAFDDKIPVLGQWLDFPLADWLELWAVTQLVEWAWGAVFGVAKLKRSNARSPL
jgi:hypothetical protein